MVIVLLMLSAFAAGVINSIAGGGSFLTFPALIFSGVPSVIANASSTVALLPGSVASGFSYRSEVNQLEGSRLKTWLVLSLLGGALGAYLLLVTSDATFRRMMPWLLLFATLVFAFGGSLSKALKSRMNIGPTAMLLFLFPVTVYGGYFGGGMGIMFLAAFRLYGMENIHGMNGMKAFLGAALNGVAALIFISARQVSWKPTLLMMVAGVIGGWVGPMLARKIHQSFIRVTVIAVGAAMTIYFFSTTHS